MAKIGDRVTTDQVIGRVDNSGTTHFITGELPDRAARIRDTLARSSGIPG